MNKLAVLTFKCIHGTAPFYLTDEFLRSSDLEALGRLRSALSSSLLVLGCTRLSTVGDRAFQSPLPTCLERTTTSRHVCAAPASFLAIVRRLVFSAVSFPTVREVTYGAFNVAFVTFLLTYSVGSFATNSVP